MRCGITSSPDIDLSLFPKQARGRIRIAIYTGRLLNLLYLIAKHSKSSPEQLYRYSSASQAISDAEFIKRVLRKETPGKSPTYYMQQSQKNIVYLKQIEQSSFRGVLELLEIIWDLTVFHRKMPPEELFLAITGLAAEKPPLHTIAGLQEKISYEKAPFRINAKDYTFIIAEYSLSRQRTGQSKMLLYIGSMEGTGRSLGLFTRTAMRTADAERLIRKQESGYAHRMDKKFALFPTLLRLQRAPYKKVAPVERYESELQIMLSELFRNEREIHSLISMDAPANMLAMAPSISLYGGLCFATAFRGEQTSYMPGGGSAKIKIADDSLKAMQALNSAFYAENSPGDRIFLALHPFTYPRISLILASYPVEFLDGLKSRNRNISRLDKMFPKLRELKSV